MNKEYTLKNAFEDSLKKTLVLPNFQRDFIWEEEKQINLLSSFILELPIGSVLMLEGSNEDFAARELCKKSSVDPDSKCIYLLDGQQRISTLFSIYYDIFSGSHNQKNWKETYDNCFSKLRRRWFIKVPKNDDIRFDLLGYRMLNYDKEVLNHSEPETIVDVFFSYSIQKTRNTDKWYHPLKLIGVKSGIKSDEDLNKIVSDIAKSAANEGLIPLYELFSPVKLKHKPIYARVIELLAAERRVELSNSCKKKDEIIKILVDVEEDISEFINAKDEKRIEAAWVRLEQKWIQEVKQFLESMLQISLPRILLPKDQINRAFAIFEQINRGGTPLDVFDLIVAKAGRNKNLEPLSTRIIEILDKKVDLPNSLSSKVKGHKPVSIIPNKYIIKEKSNSKELIDKFKNQFLNILSIFSNSKYGESSIINEQKLSIDLELVKRNRILSLNEKQINTQTKDVLKSLSRALAFLVVRCGVSYFTDLHYQLMIIPIAYVLKDDSVWQNEKMLNRIEYWYWLSVFSGRYQLNQNKVAIDDISRLFYFLKDGNNSFKNNEKDILNLPKYSSKDVLLLKDEENAPSTAIKNILIQYILSVQPLDFRKDELRINSWDGPINKCYLCGGDEVPMQIHIHHIFPLFSARTLSQSAKDIREKDRHPLNSPLNLTPITDKANYDIGPLPPETYFKEILGKARLNHFLPDIVSDYTKMKDHGDDNQYEQLLEKRYERLLEGIKNELSELES